MTNNKYKRRTRYSSKVSGRIYDGVNGTVSPVLVFAVASAFFALFPSSSATSSFASSSNLVFAFWSGVEGLSAFVGAVSHIVPQFLHVLALVSALKVFTASLICVPRSVQWNAASCTFSPQL